MCILVHQVWPWKLVWAPKWRRSKLQLIGKETMYSLFIRGGDARCNSLSVIMTTTTLWTPLIFQCACICNLLVLLLRFLQNPVWLFVAYFLCASSVFNRKRLQLVHSSEFRLHLMLISTMVWCSIVLYPVQNRKLFCPCNQYDQSNYRCTRCSEMDRNCFIIVASVHGLLEAEHLELHHHPRVGYVSSVRLLDDGANSDQEMLQPLHHLLLWLCVAEGLVLISSGRRWTGSQVHLQLLIWQPPWPWLRREADSHSFWTN